MQIIPNNKEHQKEGHSAKGASGPIPSTYSFVGFDPPPYESHALIRLREWISAHMNRLLAVSVYDDGVSNEFS